MTSTDRLVAIRADNTFESRVVAAIHVLVADGTVSKADASAVANALSQKADIAALSGKADVAALSAKADLVGGKIPTSQISAISTHETISVADRNALLALTTSQVQTGDMAVIGSAGAVEDRGLWLLTATDPTLLGSWYHLELPTGGVSSVNGQVGGVTLAAADVGATTPEDVTTAIDQTDHTPLGLWNFAVEPKVNGASFGTTGLQIVTYSGSVSTARPNATMVVWEGFPTQPTNMLDTDLWLSSTTSSSLLYGTAAPTTEGIDGDFYILVAAGVATTIYGPKANGTWPSGSTLKGAKGDPGTAGAGTTTTRVVATAAYTAAVGDLVAIDTTAGVFAVTLPAASLLKGRIPIKWVAGTTPPTLALSGADHFNTPNGPTSAAFTYINQGFIFESDGTSIWTVTADDLPLSALDTRYAPTLVKTAAPTAADDGTTGVTVGQRWVNTTTNNAYTALSVATGAAVWARLTSDIQVFPAKTGTATWTKPPWCTDVEITLIGPGGGGGSGARQAAGLACSGGAGGSAGGYTIRRMDASLLGATETVAVPLGGNGGAAQTTDSTAGITAVAPAAATFGVHLQASRGFGGTGGGLASAAVAPSVGYGLILGGQGGAGANGAVGASPIQVGGAQGGGGGGGISTANVMFAGGDSKASPSVGASAGAGIGGATGVAGTNGNGSTNNSPLPGAGGGGGGAHATTPGAGGNGGNYGGGGGGGGSSQNGSPSGAGGKGGDAICVVISR